MAKTKGLKPKDRKLATQTKGKKLTGNQWQNTPQQNMFMKNWLTPTSETFSNAYQSALKAGYSISYAAQITRDKSAQKWITEYLQSTNMDEEHTKQGIQDMYLNPQSYNNGKSPADTRLKALELLAKIQGLLDNRTSTTVNIVQPILGGQSVVRDERLHVDAEQS